MSDGGLHLHLDPIGGIAGDMFAAALLDAWPEHGPDLLAALRAVPMLRDLVIEVRSGSSAGLAGTRFVVNLPGPEGHHLHHLHHHVRYAELRAVIAGAPLPHAVIERALAILALLAEAEARVHGIKTEAVMFHEVGALDSVADIVAAAFLVERVGAAGWSTAPLPLGRGRIQTAHGTLPVPAPAVVRLLEGLPVIDDGLEGERVTPTGAAILRHLAPAVGVGPGSRRLLRSGAGLGTRSLPNMANALRVLALAGPSPATEQVAVIEFEIDDQTPEDLALGLDRLRAMDGVLDITQGMVAGKKGRIAVAVRVLARPEAREAVATACFLETRTIGVRWQVMNRTVLPREGLSAGDGGAVRVKRVERPGGLVTAKAEAADMAGTGGFAVRDARRLAAERNALGGGGDDV